MIVYIFGAHAFKMILLDAFKDLRLLQPRLFTQVNLITHFTSRCDKKSQNVIQDYAETVLLPKTDMPIKRSAAFEQTLLNKSSFLHFYYDQQNRDMSKKYIMHDGPPYANGSLHFGHVINKVLKDIICRYKMKQGYQVNFVPGWDCHGLPIEVKVLEQNLSQNYSQIEVRTKAKLYAETVIKDQLKSFQSLGILADWNNPYLTFTPNYVIQQLKAFLLLYEKGLLYRDYLPVYWSPSNLTTLAEAELEYNEKHKGYSLYFKFQVHPSSFSFYQNVFALVWTTTPWTLPANQAIAFSKSLNYNIVRAQDGTHFIVAQELIPDIQDKLNTTLVSKYSLEPNDLKNLKYIHPMKTDQTLSFLESSHVTGDKGTGLVHCAPNHGHDDFNLAFKHNLKIEPCLVNELGRFVSGLDSLLDDKDVLENGSDAVMTKLSQNVVSWSEYYHKYPYDWRSKKPVIIKTSQQWFININSIREQCLKALDLVTFYPNGTREQIKNNITSRPSWCISRQRSWGVPIPVFYSSQDKNQKVEIFSKESIYHLIQLILEKGIDAWWLLPEEELMPEKMKNELHITSDLIKSKDIFDVWVDSGLSWNYTLNEPNKIADLCLEGLDQARGWFQSSLILSVALQSKAPYKSVYVHGFAIDSEGRKMSKSLGNIVNPLDLLQDYGADVLRWYVARHASSHSSVPIDNAKFKTCKESVFKLRNTLRFCNGSLTGFKKGDCLNYQQMNAIDKYLLDLLFNYAQRCEKYYEDYQFKLLILDTQDLIEENISSFYLTAIKDRLYCDKTESRSRRSCQTVMYQIVHILNNFLSPIVPFLFEDWYSFYPCDDKKSHCFEEDLFKCPSIWSNADLAKSFDMIRGIKKNIDNLRNQTKLQLKEYVGYVHSSNSEEMSLLKSHVTESDLKESLFLSNIEFVSNHFNHYDKKNGDLIVPASQESCFSILLKKGNKFYCPRCRLYNALEEGHLCERCSLVLGSSN